MPIRLAWMVAVAGLAAAWPAPSHAGEKAEPVGGSLFEHQVAPVLERHCLSCHNGEKKKGGLVLETVATAMAGGEDGPVIVPGDPDASRIIAMVSGASGGKPKMPKKGDPLTAAQIDALRKWITDGAKWPDGVTLRPRALGDAAWWSLQRVTRPDVPTVASADAKLVRNPIDAFVLARLRETGLDPAPEADRRTLIRRLCFDLLGLPPTPEQIDTFVADPRPDAYERLVDELLDSPHYGERYARRWLDIVHYADTHGFERDRPRPHAWPYRDYVIRSLNADKPYDRFVREQIAGDALYPGDPQAMIATGYLAAGPFDLVSRVETRNAQLNREARVEELDDLVTTVITSTMALTVNCARCHDHKFDPIPQEDYYRLTALFAGTNRWDNGPQTERAVDNSGDRQVAQRRGKIEADLQTTQSQLAALGAKGVDLADVVGGGDGFGTGKVGRGIDPRSGKNANTGAQYLNNIKTNTFVAAENPLVDGVGIPDGGPDGATPTPVTSTGVTVQLPDTGGASWEYVTHGKMAGQVATDIAGVDYTSPDHSMLGLHANKFITFDLAAIRKATGYGAMRFEAVVGFGGSDGPYTAAFRVFVDGERAAGLDGLRRTSPPVPLNIPLPESARFLTLVATDDTGDLSHTQVFFGDSRLISTRPDDAADRAKLDYIAKLTAERDRLIAELAKLPAPIAGKVYTIRIEKPEATHILERGVTTAPTRPVTPGALSAIAALDPDLATDTADDGDRRKALAAWITDLRNPLTRRVIVNRLWQWHFGRGIVDTPSDFGANGSKPTHPELLDWLAAEFAEGGWSIKRMHRLIVTSAAYRRSVATGERGEAVDADNRLLWRANLRRLEAEQVRDAVLAVSGSLEERMFGEPFRDFRYVDKYAPEYHYVVQNKREFWRRSIYRFTVRSVPNVFMKVLDAPDPSILTPTRARTTTALQSLALLNNPFMLDQSRRFAERIERGVGDDRAKQIDRAYRLALGRSPTADEASAAASLVDRAGLPALCRVIFNSSEFLYVE